MVQRQLMRSLLDILATSQHLRLQGSEVSETVVAIVEDYRIFFMSHVYIVTT